MKRVMVRRLALAAAIWFASAGVVVAQDSPPAATPIATEPGGIVDNGGDPGTLSLTLDTAATIQLDDLEPGVERVVTDAVSLTIAPGGGEWVVMCSVALGVDHETSAGLESVRLRLAGTTDWYAQGADAAPCASGGNDGATVQFDLSVLVPSDATPGTFDLVVTFTVTAV
jgi:hypothetical protein